MGVAILIGLGVAAVIFFGTMLACALMPFDLDQELDRDDND